MVRFWNHTNWVKRDMLYFSLCFLLLQNYQWKVIVSPVKCEWDRFFFLNLGKSHFQFVNLASVYYLLVFGVLLPRPCHFD